MTGPSKSQRPEPSRGDDPAERPAPPFGIGMALGVITALLGVFMIVSALAGGGGIGSVGVLVGALFVAAGVMRMRLIALRRTHR